MLIVGKEQLEECLDGIYWTRYEFDEEWTEPEIFALGSLGELEYHETFPRPYFRVRTHLGAQIRGVVGSRACRLLLPRQEADQALHEFETHFTDHAR